MDYTGISITHGFAGYKQTLQVAMGVSKCATDVGVGDLPQGTTALEVGSKVSRTEKLIAWLTLISIVAIFCALAWPMFHREIFAYGDLKGDYFPNRYLYSQALQSGNSFLWEPRVYCGTYMFGAGETSMCHPLNILLYRVGLPIDIAFNLEFLFNYAWLLLGTFLLLQRWQIPRSVALFGAMTFTFGGTNLLHFVHLGRLDVVRDMPWVLLLTDVVMCSRSWKRVVLAQLGALF